MAEEAGQWPIADAPWGVSIGWMSFRYAPRSGNPDVWHSDEVESTSEFVANPTAFGKQVTSDPQHVEGPGPTSHAEMDFDLDTEWRKWFAQYLPDDNDFFLFVEDREKLRFMHRKPGRDGRCSTTCYAPVDLYLGLKNERDVSRELFRGLYAYAAQKRGWPEPPPLPPYHDGKVSGEG